MANRSRQTFLKRQKERARQERQRQKAEKRVQRKETKEPRMDSGAIDPDIEGIVPGPQLQAWEMMDVLTEEEVLAIEAEAEAAKKKNKEKES